MEIRQTFYISTIIACFRLNDSSKFSNDYERYIFGELNSLAELLKVGKVQVKHIFSSLDKEHTQCTLCLFIS